MESLIRKSLDTTIAPMVYIMMFVSVFIGFTFMTGFLVGNSESILYSAGVLVHKQAWGALLFVTATTAEIGFVLKKQRLMQLGGIAGFMAWLFASIALALQGHLYVLVSVALLHLLFHGYVYLASSLGYIYRRSVSP